MRFNKTRKVTLLLVLPVALLATLAYTQRQQVPSNWPEEAQLQAQDLVDTLRPDNRGRLAVTEYDPEVLARVLQGLESSHVGVQRGVLGLIGRILRQWKMPPEALEAVARKVRMVQDQHKGYVRDIQWQLGLRAAGSKQDQLKIADEGLYSPSEQIVDWAIEYMVEVGGEEAKELLRRAQKIRDDQGGMAKARRIRLGVKKIEVNEELARRTEGEQLDYVWELLGEYIQKKPGWGTFDFVLWLMDKMEALETVEAVWKLKQIYETEGYDRQLQYAAQEALVRRGVMLPDQRKIIYIH